MPWDLYIKHYEDDRPLGRIEEVKRRLCSALPGIKFEKELSGAEKLKSLADQGVELPDAIKQNFLRSEGSYRAVYEGDRFSIEFYLGQESTVGGIVVEVRGKGDPLAAIERLMRIENWVVHDSRLEPPTKAAWDQFAKWRDDAIESIRNEEEE